jgi:hypothetical protein
MAKEQGFGQWRPPRDARKQVLLVIKDRWCSHRRIPAAWT